MPGPLLHLTPATATCPHVTGQITIATSNARVLVSGQPVATVADLATIVGCSFTTPAGTYQPCMQVKWAASSTRVLVNGSAALFQSGHLCQFAGGIPAGPAILVGQARVVGE